MWLLWYESQPQCSFTSIRFLDTLNFRFYHNSFRHFQKKKKCHHCADNRAKSFVVIKDPPPPQLFLYSIFAAYKIVWKRLFLIFRKFTVTLNFSGIAPNVPHQNGGNREFIQNHTIKRLKKRKRSEKKVQVHQLSSRKLCW